MNRREVFVLALLLALSGCLFRGDAAARLGIDLVTVRLSAQRHLVDVRYRITDPEKAAALVARDAKPQLLDEASGEPLAVPSYPKMGALRAKGHAEAGRSYFILFENRSGTVKSGSRVTLALGDLKLAHLVVE